MSGEILNPPDPPDWIPCDACLGMFHEDNLVLVNGKPDELGDPLLCKSCAEDRKAREDDKPDAKTN